MEVTTNIESQEHRRRCNNEFGPEHPRAGTSDDVETFFSVCHQRLGDNFTLEDFKYRWRRLIR